jgi:hypothetical protein
MRPRHLAALVLASSLAAPAAGAAQEAAARLPGARALKVAAGLGMVAASDQGGVPVEGTGDGLYAGAEYVLRPASWFSPRLYGGLLLTKPAADCGPGVQPCDVSASYAFGGAKARFLAPIPWVAPFLELGFGLSLGQFTTQSGPLVDVREVGLTYHWPFTLGVALGAHRQYELAFVYLFHPQQAQFSGGFAFGYQFDLD